MSHIIAGQKAIAVLDACRKAGIMIATAESCTGGLIAAALTDIPGSSDVVDRGFVTYSNEAKNEMLAIPMELIAHLGAVSKEVAIAMAEAALVHSRAGVSIAVTGIAGPGGGSAEKPVGLVHIASARTGQATLHRECRFGEKTRTEIRHATVLAALDLVLDALHRA
ncbi:CinA family protein [Brucella suis]|uniref:Competence/damage-inducible protein CinA C-terminal domain n=1 Tax=Brucella suis (strain ATCC 23445 / NCTC 10510) TaxID=470137 RepID=B0CGS1_BRUSI|nr:CinA family protein [Brucella suis]ABY38222.1 competence/damage-inducible protein CinA C-terminal domain [Brucella suis ATCC 23445]AIB17856.1 C-terminal domain of CinA type S; Protein Implicated in DNA repair function with RecA and MutS [Brucella suis bv. 2]AIB20689.1 C-terminal domain of CinA type S; Protein Implicated in DNA repair function with RecA and MutS [Brucella suis bv. 2]AIB24049.1 C-terminal domain of CinA type S; Protein Implicated in DNA repair function with RecA and MutS [Bruc